MLYWVSNGKTYNMKPIPVIIAILMLRCMIIYSQDTSPASDRSGIEILVPEGQYISIDGRKTEIKEFKYPGSLVLKQDNPSGRSVFIEKKRSALKSETGKNSESYFNSFLEETGKETGINNLRDKFQITSVTSDKLGITHIRSVQYHKGIEIYGSESVYHIDQEKERFTGSIHRLPDDLPYSPDITENWAVTIAVNDLKKNNSYRELTPDEKKFLGYSEPSTFLTYYNNKDKSGYTLCWSVALKSNFISEWRYFINASNGEIILKYNNTKTDGPAIGTGYDLNSMMRTFNVYQTAGIFYLYDISQKMFNPVTNEGIILTLDGNSTSTLNLDYTYVTSANNSWSQQAAISAHCNAAKTYQYFDTTFNRNSINGKGGNIISVVNLINDDGSPMENAFWNGQAVFYGNGGGNFKSIAGALDVTAHELSHGVISSTANLDYYGQPGAINESYADIFACMIDRNDWTIGEDITLESYSPSGVIRDLSNPHNKGTSADGYWQPTHTSEMFLGDEDNAGIHLNSGIINYAFFTFATRIGKSKAEQVFYRALTEYLTKSSGFIDLRIAIVQSARDLYGDSSIEMHEAAWAFESVGIYEEQLVDKTPLYEANPGEEMLLTYDTNPLDPVSLYLSTSGGTNYRPLTNTPMVGKASVTDDGKTAVFVSAERRIRMIHTGTSDVNEQIISGFNYYDNVAISKNGQRLAATRGFADGSVYVIDLVSGEGRQFLLYNPTSKPGTVDAGGVLKAYSIEFDITGEYIIYDANNVINSNSTIDIYYRDIGFIRVWDNNLKYFGDGKISKLFSALPAHVNVANPVFSKNSPNIIAFDYFYDDGILENYSVYAANLETGETKQISVNDRLGYPSFSTHDNYIAFSSINNSNMQVVKSMKLAADKITPVGDPGVLVPDAKWPVYFTRGIRMLGLAPVSDFTTDFKYGNYPVTSRFIDLSTNKPVSWQWKFEGGIPSESFDKNPVVTFPLPGFYRVSLVTSNDFGSDTLVRERYIHAVNPVSADDHDINAPGIFPNPVVGELHISFEDEFSVMIFDLQGQIIHSSSNTDAIDLSDLKSGLYLLEIKTERSSYVRKFVKQ